MISKQTIKNIKFIFSLVIIYVLVFELIISDNKYIPSPLVLSESILHIITVYNFFFALLFSFSIVYLSILLSFFIVYYFRGALIKNLIKYRNKTNLLSIFKYFPAFFVIIIFSVWFKENNTAEIVFCFLVSFFMLLKKINKLIIDVKEEHIIFAHQINPKRIFSEVYWKSIFPKLYSYLYELQVYLWILILIYEFVSETRGVGFVYKLAFNYNDIGGLFSISIIMSIVLLLCNLFIKNFEKKKIYWSI